MSLTNQQEVYAKAGGGGLIHISSIMADVGYDVAVLAQVSTD